MKTLLLTLVLSLLLIPLHAQGEQKDQTGSLPNEFGIHLGSTTGIGMSYRHWFNKFGIQVTGIPFKTKDEFFSSLGLTAMYSFVEKKTVRVFGYLGNHYIHDQRNVDNGTTVEKKYKDRWAIGIGPGFSLGRTVAFNIMAGYGMYDILGQMTIMPAGEIGLYYRF